jgi:L-amino acid N-acyltransferase YncA
MEEIGLRDATPTEYIDRRWRGKGVGTRLYERFGFRAVDIYREQGCIDGRWVDTIIMEKLLGGS